MLSSNDVVLLLVTTAAHSNDENGGDEHSDNEGQRTHYQYKSCCVATTRSALHLSRNTTATDASTRTTIMSSVLEVALQL